MKRILVKDVVGSRVDPEDGILLKESVKESLNEKVVLDFAGIGKVPVSFFANMLTEYLMNRKDRSLIEKNISVKNLDNAKDFTRVLMGTSLN
ncbi:DUF4325 domain-containing protein [Clostridium sp. JN-9]|uniref:STAS-like domain-containing protein n=1 Tax=Clostridium sp. JN-9 TaxID=2507159 RepID=UPI000FFE18B4|nr:DUF4325 domain-containing protein [Clostridium sp. JN-9]QAT41486.1 DUF4325 domain-containing protein [Clostridium sp. JN-9]